MALFRAVAHDVRLPPWPDLTDPNPEHVGEWVAWMRQVWVIGEIADAVGHASPVLAKQVHTLCAADMPAVRDAYRAALSLVRYLLRMTRRPTPFGLFAGVAAASFGPHPRLHLGTGYRAIGRAEAGWLDNMIAQLEQCPELLGRLTVVANSTMTVRGDRLIVPYQPHTRPGQATTAVDVAIRHTPQVEVAVEVAGDPIRLNDLAAKLQAEYPTAAPAAVTAMLTGLVAHRALITSLHAPSTEPDALGYLLAQLGAADADAIAPIADIVHTLRQVHTQLDRHNAASAGEARALRRDIAVRMRSVAETRRHPVAVDVRLDTTVVLPDHVAREVQRAALVLARLSPYPYGTPAWRSYHQRFYERYGIGSMVPLMDVVDPDVGIGWPDGYPGTGTPERPSPVSRRDEQLLAMAQSAMLDGRDEVVLDEHMVAALNEGEEPPRLPPHLELCVRVHAADQRALAEGDSTVEVVSVSRGAGVLSGRFLSVLDRADRQTLTAGLAHLPANDHQTRCAQLSFPPLDPTTGHVARAVQTLPTVISLAEHRGADPSVLTVKDLAVACDGRRMYLAAPNHCHRLEAVGLHALNLRRHSPPIARFLTELGRAQCAQVTMFDWGLAAAALAFLPRVRCGRTTLSAAMWRLDTAELPGNAAPWSTWDAAWDAWRTKRCVPRCVHLVEEGQWLTLDLDETAHRVLLRRHLIKHRTAVLAEAPDSGNGWCGGRPNEIIVPLAATASPLWPRLPIPTRARVIGRDHGHTPGASTVLLAKLYGGIASQEELLSQHLPHLLAEWDSPPAWWFLRYRDPDQHLRLRITLPSPDAFGPTAAKVSTWADELHRHGLLREVTYATSYPETGRWGSGPAMAAAEAVFGADSHAVITQLGQRARPHRQALAAANMAAIAVAYTASTAAGMQWLIDHVPAPSPQPVPRPVFDEAVRLADPSDDWANLRKVPGGEAVVDSWRPRTQALAAYRAHLPGPHTQGIDPDDVLGSLMHAHFIRVVGIDFDDEAVCVYLARAAALAWSARTGGRR